MSAKVVKDCRYGIECHGAKSGMCPYTHPKALAVCKEIVMCRNGWECHGRSNGKCYFAHPTEAPQKTKEKVMCRNG